MTLFNGVILSTPTNQPEQLNRIYYKQDVLLIRDSRIRSRQSTPTPP